MRKAKTEPQKFERKIRPAIWVCRLGFASDGKVYRRRPLLQRILNFQGVIYGLHLF